MQVRDAHASELPQLARLWHAAWHEAHAAIVPAALTKLRTVDSFERRLAALLPKLRATGPAGAPTGFCALKADELYQLFVAAPARGTGAAAALIADGEARLAAEGVKVAWLACAIGNDRAARFYEKQGWHRARTFVDEVDTSDGPFPVEVWRYEKVLTPP